VARARDIIAGKKVNAYQVKAFFDRHRQNYLNAKMKGLKPEESRAIQAWLIWGGEPLRKQAEREVAKDEKGLTNKNPPKKAKKKAMARKKNPFETQQKARFISDGIWFYRGYEIQTKRRTSKSGKKKGFSVIFEQVMTSPSCPPVKDHHPWLEQFTGFIVPDETAAIAMARIIIDKSCYHATLTGDDYQNFINMDYALADAVYMSSGPDGKAKVTRSNVTRRLEQKCGRPAAAKVYQRGYAFFNSLPIKDRIAWVDSEIRLFNLQEGRPLNNPPKKAKKKMSRRKKNPNITGVNVYKGAKIPDRIFGLRTWRSTAKSKKPTSMSKAQLKRAFEKLKGAHSFAYVAIPGRGDEFDRVDVYVNDKYVGYVTAFPQDVPKPETEWFANGGGDLELHPSYGGRYFTDLQGAAIALHVAENDPSPNADRQAEKPLAPQPRLGKKLNRYQLGIGPGDRIVLNRKKKAKKKKKATTAKELVSKCQKLWEAYCEKPGVTKLRAVAKHCEAMKASKAKSVKAERSRCMRSIRAEAKDRGWKI
jgi:hypothetical protein